MVSEKILPFHPSLKVREPFSMIAESSLEKPRAEACRLRGSRHGA
jgi:hypothetical protein